jgi:hypothetical protein
MQRTTENGKRPYKDYVMGLKEHYTAAEIAAHLTYEKMFVCTEICTTGKTYVTKNIFSLVKCDFCSRVVFFQPHNIVLVAPLSILCCSLHRKV